MPSQLIIKSHNPWKFWLKLVLQAIGMLLVAWVMYIYGQESAGYNNSALQNEQRRLQEQLYNSGKVAAELREKYTVLEQSTAIDRQAYDSVNISLKGLQSEILELQEQVAFYTGILSPKETASGLHLTSLNFSHIDDKNSYRFKLVLAQLNHNERLIRGQASLTIEGVVNGEPKQLSLSEASGGVIKTLKLNFKYFQTLEGDVVLPEGFTPSRVLVDLHPVGKGTSRIKKNFDWTDIAS